MKWTDINEPTEGISYYNHVLCDSPLGLIKIEWKGWKDRPSYDVEINGEWICQEYSLHEAKETTRKWLKDRAEEILRMIKHFSEEDATRKG